MQQIHCLECDSLMVKEQKCGVTIDVCPVCSAVWFDASEIGPWMLEERPTVDGAPDDDDFAVSTQGAGSSPCPRCPDQHLELGDLRGVAFERCPGCGGLFLSKEGLENLVKSKPGQRVGDSITIRDVFRALDELLRMRYRHRVWLGGDDPPSLERTFYDDTRKR